MQCSVYIRIQDGGDRAHGKTIARASPYRKRGLERIFSRRHGEPREVSSGCRPLTPTSSPPTAGAQGSAIHHFAFNIQNYIPPVPLCLRKNSRALAAE